MQTIADSNGGIRLSGTRGYDLSVRYVATLMRAAGYKVDIQEFDFVAFEPLGPSILSQTAPASIDYEFNIDFTFLSQTEPGTATGPVTPDLDLGLDNASTSGCEPEDFAGFPAGHIALIQRGACTFQQKAENAAAAGAIAAIIFNQGNTDEPDRQGLVNATLSAEYSGGIPALFATYPLGIEWASTPGLVLSLETVVSREPGTTSNVIAESRGGRNDSVVMVGAHLDSVAEGPGIQDNGSGSAAILEVALQMRNVTPVNKVRFAWWGAEESGLIGSDFYVFNLPEQELSNIALYLNFDMIGSPNFFYGVYDGDGSDFELEGPPGSAAIEAFFEEFYLDRGLPFEGSEISFRSDYAAFFDNGIPFGGLFTGAEVIKTEEQAAIYGGTAGEQFDPCYHIACGTYDNISLEALNTNADAVAAATLAYVMGRASLAEPAGQARRAAKQQILIETRGDYYIR